jgi:Ca2+-binding RTX toxin-like protein
MSIPPPPSTRALSKLGDESKYTIDYLGSKDDNTLTSTVTNKDEIFVAGAGNDTLTGNGGMDVIIDKLIAVLSCLPKMT